MISNHIFIEEATTKRQHISPTRTPEAIMFTQTNSIVLLWLLPVLLNIVLPLTLLAGWLMLKPFMTFKQHETEKQVSHAGVDTALSATGK